MSLYPCTACHKRAIGVKLANVTTAWWTAANKRLAYRSRLCPACYVQRIAPLSVAAESEALTCPACGIDTLDDMDPVYFTSFLPGYGKVQLELPTCAPCAAIIRIWAQDSGELMQDAASGGQDPGPQTLAPADSAWANLGLYPRE